MLLLERGQEPLRRLGGRAQRAHNAAHVLQQDVGVARRAESRSQPPELCTKPLAPFPVEKRPRGTQERARAAGRDAHLVKVLGIGAEARTRIVLEQAPMLRTEREPQRLLRCRLGRSRGRFIK